MGMKSSGGEIVQVQGGHIVRSTGRKDRHSKVFTAKGPRDRRVRLSAQTAIQFYDVQDRLGYDRPSKAVDWLIKKAKSAIDKLVELPPWNPTAEQLQQEGQNGGSSEMAMAEQSEFQRQLGENPDTHSGFLPPPIDAADAIAFFPTTSGTSSINFQNYPSGIISRTTHSTEDLGLSLHSLAANQTPSNGQTLFAGSNPVEFESNYPRIVTWNNDASTDMNRAGFMMNSQPLLFQGSAFPQRGTLQSSFSPLVHHNHKSQQPVHQASIFGSRFVSDGLPEFSIPVRIHGEQEENHGVASHKPSSASSNSHL